jgi:hypothetical protein
METMIHTTEVEPRPFKFNVKLRIGEQDEIKFRTLLAVNLK